MEDEIIDVKTEIHTVTLNLKTGKKIETPARTIYTIYKSGRQDCKLEIQKPIDVNSKAEDIV